MEEIKDEDLPEPRVTLFGEEIGRSDGFEKKEKGDETGVKEKKMEYRCRYDHYHHHRCCGGGVWGMAVLISGTVLLLNTLGMVPWDFWNAIVSFWPVLLVLMGTSILLGRNWFSRMITFIMAFAAFVFILIYGLIKVDSSFVSYVPSEAVDFVDNFTDK